MVKRIIGNPTTTPMAIPDWNQDKQTKADHIKNKPTKLSQFENDTGFVTDKHTHNTTDIATTFLEDGSVDATLKDTLKFYDNYFSNLYPRVYSLEDNKADKPTIETSANTSYTFDFSDNYNNEVRLTAPSAISIKFVDDEYSQDYISGLSFNCGDTPTGFDYTASGIINWVGTDCTKDGDLSIFQPSANTHYDIVFYFNGSQFIGLVNGFVPATGNVVSV